MTTIERAARAIAKRNYPGGSDSDIDEMWEGFAADARAVIESIREPSSAMLDRFVSRALCVSISGEGGWSAYGRNQWRAMIDAALAE